MSFTTAAAQPIQLPDTKTAAESPSTSYLRLSAEQVADLELRLKRGVASPHHALKM